MEIQSQQWNCYHVIREFLVIQWIRGPLELTLTMRESCIHDHEVYLWIL